MLFTANDWYKWRASAKRKAKVYANEAKARAVRDERYGLKVLDAEEGKFPFYVVVEHKGKSRIYYEMVGT